MERTFVLLNNFIRDLNSYIGYCVMRKPEKATEISQLANDIAKMYSAESIKLAPSNFENYSFKDLKKIIDYAESIYEKIDKLQKLVY